MDTWAKDEAPVPAGRDTTTPVKQVRAMYDDATITVYQAYSSEIAEPALKAQTFVPPFGMARMTWVKPSFLWMMYRSGWGSKPGQERVLAVHLTRSGFEQALSESVLSHYDAELHPDQQAWRESLGRSSVRIQWDPERTPDGSPLPHRSLQMGLAGPAVRRYVSEWVVGLEDVTPTLPDRRTGRLSLPLERPYPLPSAIARHVGATT